MSKKISSRCKWSLLSSNDGTKFLECLLKMVEKYSESSTMSNDAKVSMPKLKLLHATDCYCQNVAGNKTCRLLDRSQTHNEKMTARMGIYARRMERLREAHLLDDKSPITILRYLAQFKNFVIRKESRVIWLCCLYLHL